MAREGGGHQYTREMPESIGLLGGGAHADEVEEYALSHTVVFRAVGDAYVDRDDSRSLGISEAKRRHGDLPVVAAVGAPALRRELVEAWGDGPFATVVAEAAMVARTASVAEGAVVAPGAVLSTRVRIGSHALINIAATVSHDTVVGDFATISPGVHLAGRCVVGDGAFLGIGAAVIEDVVIGAGVVVGAGAAVVHDLLDPGVYAGVPAVRVRDQTGWLRELRGPRR